MTVYEPATDEEVAQVLTAFYARDPIPIGFALSFSWNPPVRRVVPGPVTPPPWGDPEKALLDTRLDTVEATGWVGMSPVLVATSTAPAAAKRLAAVVLTGSADQIAINAALATYGQIRLSAGTVFLSGPLRPPSGTAILGAGNATELRRDGTLVSSYASAIEIVGTAAAHITNVTIRDLRITGPSTQAAMVASNGITLNYADHVEIVGCDISGFGALGDDGTVAATNATQLQISDGNHHDSLNGPIMGKAGGITPPSCTDVLITRNRLHHNWADGSHGQQCDRIQWISNRAYSNGESGIDLLGCWDCVISGNVCTANGHEGIEVGQTVAANREDRGHAISGNTCTANHTTAGAGGGGILLSGKTAHCAVTGNVCRANLHAGIHLGNTSASYLVEHNLIGSNVCENNLQVGIHVSGNANNNIVQGNSVKNNGDRGIDMTTSGTTPTGTVVQQNVIAGNVGVAVYRSGGIDATTIVRGNVGYVTEAKGTSTIADTAGSVVVTHGLAATPAAVTVTPQASAAVWVSARTATTFTVSRTGISGAVAVDWSASV